MSETTRVLVVGPDISVRGGISSLERLMLENCPEGLELIQLSTTKDSSRTLKFFQGIVSWIKFPLYVMLKRPKVVHIHFSVVVLMYTCPQVSLVYLDDLCQIDEKQERIEGS